MGKSEEYIKHQNATTDYEKEECVSDYRKRVKEWRANNPPSDLDHHCEDCMACAGRFTDGETLQTVLGRMIKEGKITCQRD